MQLPLQDWPCDLAWAAGFIDGEGCFQISRRRPGKGGNAAYLIVGQAVRKPLDKLRELFGGSVQRRKSGLWVWTVCSRRLAVCARQILPFLVVKAREARLVVNYQSLVSRVKNERLTDWDHGLREWYHSEMTQCRKGVHLA